MEPLVKSAEFEIALRREASLHQAALLESAHKLLAGLAGVVTPVAYPFALFHAQF